MPDAPRPSAAARARTLAARALHRIAHLRPVRWPSVLYRFIDRSRTFGLAAEMAFWFFLGLIPLAAVVGMIAVKLTVRAQGTVLPLLTPLPGSVRAFVGQELGHVSAWSGGTVGPIAGAVFVWLASSGLHAVFDALELATQAKPRPWWKKRLLSIAGCVGLSLGVAIITALGVGLEWLTRLSGAREAIQDHPPVLGWAVRVGLAAAISLGLVAGLYRLGIPTSKARQMPTVPGVLLAVALQFLLVYGYRFYIAKLGDGSAYLASLATIGVTMMVLYLMGIALLTGAELNQLLAVTRAVKSNAARAAPPKPGPVLP
jgi:membrane protein